MDEATRGKRTFNELDRLVGIGLGVAWSLVGLAVLLLYVAVMAAVMRGG